ncbi:MAG: M23 family metallopeptidase [Sphaerochaetaceae bacterium]|nr:M23 family metallopeptidase [Sphaerochaetaceae bacterium]
MSRDSYDDIQYSSDRRRSSSRGGRGNVGLLALFCVLLFLVSLIAYMIFSQPKDSASNKTETSKVVEEKTSEIKENVTVKQLDLEETKADVIKFTTHKVVKGEDITTISERYGLKIQTVISVNKLKNVANLEEGMLLQIPDRDCQLYIVQAGDFLSKIAMKFNPGLGWKKLQELNGLKNDKIYVGQEIYIPDLPIVEEKVSTGTEVVFKKPVNGTITASFGERLKGKNKSLDGVYISGEENASITAASKGSVVDVGNSPELGRFVILQHEGGYKTSYAFLDRVDVKVGSEVSEGSVIGTISTESSQSDRPRLYFKIEQLGIALDPAIFF